MKKLGTSAVACLALIALSNAAWASKKSDIEACKQALSTYDVVSSDLKKALDQARGNTKITMLLEFSPTFYLPAPQHLPHLPWVTKILGAPGTQTEATVANDTGSIFAVVSGTKLPLTEMLAAFQTAGMIRRGPLVLSAGLFSKTYRPTAGRLKDLKDYGRSYLEMLEGTPGFNGMSIIRNADTSDLLLKISVSDKKLVSTLQPVVVALAPHGIEAVVVRENASDSSLAFPQEPPFQRGMGAMPLSAETITAAYEKYRHSIIRLPGVSGIDHDENGLNVYLENDTIRAAVEAALEDSGVPVKFTTTGAFKAQPLPAAEPRHQYGTGALIPPGEDEMTELARQLGQTNQNLKGLIGLNVTTKRSFSWITISATKEASSAELARIAEAITDHGIDAHINITEMPASGAPLKTPALNLSIMDDKLMRLYNGSIPPGAHNIEVMLTEEDSKAAAQAQTWIKAHFGKDLRMANKVPYAFVDYLTADQLAELSAQPFVKYLRLNKDFGPQNATHHRPDFSKISPEITELFGRKSVIAISKDVIVDPPKERGAEAHEWIKTHFGVPTEASGFGDLIYVKRLSLAQIAELSLQTFVTKIYPELELELPGTQPVTSHALDTLIPTKSKLDPKSVAPLFEQYAQGKIAADKTFTVNTMLSPSTKAEQDAFKTYVTEALGLKIGFEFFPEESKPGFVTLEGVSIQNISLLSHHPQVRNVALPAERKLF